MHKGPKRQYTTAEIEHRVQELGPWFHNLNLQGVPTAPEHFLGDYPAIKWQQFANALPADLRGKSVLDIGCNAGFFSIEMKRRGAARVLAIDSDPRYLAQAQLAAEITGSELELRRMSVYEVDQLGEQFDLVLFTGVFYHLRHPLLALDLIREHTVRDVLVFQSMQRGGEDVRQLAENYPFEETELFMGNDVPRMQFVERRYSDDPTNWWIPNRACVEAVLRSAGFAVVSHPEVEVYVCKRAEVDRRVRTELSEARGGLKP
jgi:tRNA (mo5U34)-methyltransferase